MLWRKKKKKKKQFKYKPDIQFKIYSAVCCAAPCCSVSNILLSSLFSVHFLLLCNSQYLFLNNFPHYFGMKEHIFIQRWIEGSEGGGGVVGGRGAREVDFRLPLQFQERMQLIMIRDVPGKGQLKLQQA